MTDLQGTGSFDFDLVVVGAGSGGVRASRVAAQSGARVAVVERARLGGTCVNVGCVPKKLMVYAAGFSDQMATVVGGFGWSVKGAQFDWATLISNKDREINRLNQVYRRLLDESGVTLVEGEARLVDRHTVAVGDHRLTSARILIATGSAPSTLDIPGAEHLVTSNELFSLPDLPRRVVVIGGGYIAVEFAGIFSGLGCQTSLIHRGDLPLRGFDLDLREGLKRELGNNGITPLFNRQVQRVDRRQSAEGAPELQISVDDGTTIDCDLALAAVGRSPATRSLGLEGVGVALNDKGAVIVDDNFQSSVASIFALGDVIDRLQLTPVAIEEAMVLVHNLFGGEQRRQMDYEHIPTAVFSRPQIGTVGLSELQALERYGADAVTIYRAAFKSLKHSLSGSDERTICKLVVERRSDRVLGCHMLGADAAEIVQGLAIALKCGATKAQFDATVGVHPTAAEEFVTLRRPTQARADRP